MIKEMRAPFQVLVIPFIIEGPRYYYAIFKRKDLAIWQFIAGGGEKSETPLEAARREAYEEAGISKESFYIKLTSITTIPAVDIHGLKWGEKIIMIPEFVFAVELHSKKLKITSAHTQYLWLSYKDAVEKLKYDSNKSALWELNHRLKTNTLDAIPQNIQQIKKFL